MDRDSNSGDEVTPQFDVSKRRKILESQITPRADTQEDRG